jgi:hypothetical protein
LLEGGEIGMIEIENRRKETMRCGVAGESWGREDGEENIVNKTHPGI